jgi:nuclease S1
MPIGRTSPLQRAVAIALAILLSHQSASRAWAWGRVGHRVIAKLAERHLTERAKAEIKALLEPGESLADASTWADEVRGKMRHTAPWH